MNAEINEASAINSNLGFNFWSSKLGEVKLKIDFDSRFNSAVFDGKPCFSSLPV